MTYDPVATPERAAEHLDTLAAILRGAAAARSEAEARAACVAALQRHPGVGAVAIHVGSGAHDIPGDGRVPPALVERAIDEQRTLVAGVIAVVPLRSQDLAGVLICAMPSAAQAATFLDLIGDVVASAIERARAREERARRSAAERAHLAAAPVRTSDSPLVYVVDSDPARRGVLSHELAMLWRTEAFGSASALQAALEAQPPAVVVLDAELEGASPADVVAMLRGSAALRDVPLIVVAPHAHAPESLHAGAADVVERPYNTYDLVARVRAQLSIAAFRARSLDAERRVAAENAALLQKARAAEAELLRSNAELEQFAYVASHDLQEPLRMIASFVQLLERRYGDKLDEDARRWIGHAVSGTVRMKALIEDLLRFSRVGKRQEKFSAVPLDAVVAHVREELRPLLDEAGAEIAVASALPVVHGHAGLLTQVLENLVANAIKFRRPDAPPRIALSAVRRGDVWEVSVADNGMGIEPQYFDRIFIVFQRLHGHQLPGTGMGLAIVKKIVERHGGRVWVTSTPGSGSTFTFTLPAADAPAGEASSGEAPAGDAPAGDAPSREAPSGDRA